MSALVTWRLILKAHNIQLAQPGFPDSTLLLWPLARVEFLVPELPTWFWPTALPDLPVHCDSDWLFTGLLTASAIKIAHYPPVPIVYTARSALAWLFQSGSHLVSIITSHAFFQYRNSPGLAQLLRWMSPYLYFLVPRTPWTEEFWWRKMLQNIHSCKVPLSFVYKNRKDLAFGLGFAEVRKNSAVNKKLKIITMLFFSLENLCKIISYDSKPVLSLDL